MISFNAIISFSFASNNNLSFSFSIARILFEPKEQPLFEWSPMVKKKDLS